MDISCIVLAGGKGLRLGHNKILEIFDNTSLLERALSNLSFLDSDIIIVTAAKQSLPQFVVSPMRRVVADIYPEKGPLGGIYTGLVASDSFYNLVVASDMPFLNRALLRHMIQLSDGFDLILPRLGATVEPLHAVYSKGCLSPIERILKQGNLSIRQLFPRVRIRYMEAEEIDRFDPAHLSFFNINTEADLEKARQLARREVSHDKC